MPFESALFLSIVIGALSVFTVVVAYGQWVTRDLSGADISPAVKPSKASGRPANTHPPGAAHA
jgi:hypothetical protein